MPRPKPKPRPAPQPTTHENPWPARLTRLAFFLALILTAARATTLETLREVILPTPGADAAARDAGPTTSLVFNLLFCLPAFLILLRRAIDATYVIRWSWLHGILLALGLWSMMSVAWAADRFAAIVHASTFAASLLLLWSMIQLVRSWLRLRLGAGVAFGALLIYLASGLHYRLSELPRLRADWMENREMYLKLQGLEPESFAARQFEQKVLAGDVGRFSSSPNTYAAALVMLGIAAAGVAIQRRANRDPLGWLIAMLLAIPAAAFVIYHTHSRVAMLTPILAIAAFAVIAFKADFLAQRARRLYWAGVGLFLVGVLAFIGHGLYHGSLPERSLTFRWYYWSGAGRIIADHPLLGVGFANFGNYYPSVRLPLAVEQVKDPHNVFVRFFAELGVVGGLLAIAFVFRLVWEVTRPQFPAEDQPALPAQRPILLIAGLAFAAAFLNALTSIDWDQSSAYLTIAGFERFVAGVLLFAGLLVVVFQSLRQETLDTRPAPWMLYGFTVAIGIFLLHNLIDFSLFETGPMTLFALLAGATLGARHPSAAGQRRKTIMAVAALTLLSLAAVAFAGLVLAPIATAESRAAAGDSAIRREAFPDAVRQYLAAREAWPSNADYAFRAANALAYDAAPAQQVRDLVSAAIAANPREARYHVFLANYERRQPNPDLERIRASYQNALALDPRDVSLRLEFAQALEALKDSAAAVQQYKEALAHDATLPPDEPKRLSPERRQEIQAKLRI